MRIPNPFKPWFVYRPGQFVRRLTRAARPPTDPLQTVGLPWGCPIEVDIRETIGRSIWTAGVHDLAAVEVLVRLADRGSLALDVGANVGAMTGALASRAGEVWAFEPHPQVHLRLVGNAARFAGRPGFATCRVFDLALSDAEGDARMDVPTGFTANHGLARLAADGNIPVRTARLDALLGSREVGVMKVDVEGHESAVFRGGSAALAAGRVRHIVFEEHAGPQSEVCRLLTGFGYSLFRINWRMRGPRLEAADAPGRAYEAPNFLATRDPAGATARCRSTGWECFRKVPTA